MTNVYTRRINMPEESTPKADYSPEELVRFLITRYKKAPIEALKMYHSNLEVGYFLFKKTETLLRGLGYAKR